MWCINSPKFSEQVQALQSGTTRKRISRKNLATVNLRLPPLADQHQIAERTEAAFSRVEALEVAVRGLLVRIEVFRQSVLAEAFAGRLVPQHPGDEPASVLLDRIQADRETVEKERGRVKA